MVRSGENVNGRGKVPWFTLANKEKSAIASIHPISTIKKIRDCETYRPTRYRDLPPLLRSATEHDMSIQPRACL